MERSPETSSRLLELNGDVCSRCLLLTSRTPPNNNFHSVLEPHSKLRSVPQPPQFRSHDRTRRPLLVGRASLRDVSIIPHNRTAIHPRSTPIRHDTFHSSDSVPRRNSKKVRLPQVLQSLPLPPFNSFLVNSRNRRISKCLIPRVPEFFPPNESERSFDEPFVSFQEVNGDGPAVGEVEHSSLAEGEVGRIVAESGGREIRPCGGGREDVVVCGETDLSGGSVEGKVVGSGGGRS